MHGCRFRLCYIYINRDSKSQCFFTYSFLIRVTVLYWYLVLDYIVLLLTRFIPLELVTGRTLINQLLLDRHDVRCLRPLIRTTVICLRTQFIVTVVTCQWRGDKRKYPSCDQFHASSFDFRHSKTKGMWLSLSTQIWHTTLSVVYLIRIRIRIFPALYYTPSHCHGASSNLARKVFLLSDWKHFSYVSDQRHCTRGGRKPFAAWLRWSSTRVVHALQRATWLQVYPITSSIRGLLWLISAHRKLDFTCCDLDPAILGMHFQGIDTSLTFLRFSTQYYLVNNGSR